MTKQPIIYCIYFTNGKRMLCKGASASTVKLSSSMRLARDCWYAYGSMHQHTLKIPTGTKLNLYRLRLGSCSKYQTNYCNQGQWKGSINIIVLVSLSSSSVPSYSPFLPFTLHSFPYLFSSLLLTLSSIFFPLPSLPF